MAGQLYYTLHTFKENLELTRLLINSGANVNAKDENGKSALDYAEDEKIKKVILDYLKH